MAKKAKPQGPRTGALRSRLWFDNPDNPGMTALYLERYLNNGLTKEELTSGKPIIGIAQSGSDLVPCNRHHLELAKRVRDGISAAGGVALEFPAIVLSGGPMLDGWYKGQRVGAGAVIWQSRRDFAAGLIDYKEFIDRAA